MHTIAPRLFLATSTAARPLGFYHPVLRAAPAAISVAHGPALGAAVFVVLAIVLVAALSSAARGLADVMSQLLRAATAVTSLFFTILISVVFALVIVVHH
jgi:hypothetical protein